jgi:glycosyltransferase involved in cell wall biosynthesis
MKEILEADYIIDASHQKEVMQEIAYFHPEAKSRTIGILNGLVTHTPYCPPYNLVVGSIRWKELSLLGLSQFFETPWEQEYGGRITPLPTDSIVAVIPWACLPSNSTILTSNGEKYIQDIQVGNIVLGYGNAYTKPTEVTAIHRRRYRGLMYQIVTSRGKKLNATSEHPICTLNGDGIIWQGIDKISVGDIIAVINREEILHGKGSNLHQRGRQSAEREIPNRNTHLGVSRTIRAVPKGNKQTSTISGIKEKDTRWSKKNLEAVESRTGREFKKSLATSTKREDYGGIPRLYLVSHLESCPEIGFTKQVPILRLQLSTSEIRNTRNRIYSWYCRWRGKYQYNKIKKKESFPTLSYDCCLQYLNSINAIFRRKITFRYFYKSWSHLGRLAVRIYGAHSRISSYAHFRIIIPLPNCKKEAGRTSISIRCKPQKTSPKILYQRGNCYVSRSESIKWETVTSVRCYPFDDLVYNLTTTTQDYYAQGILVHNCNTDFYCPNEEEKSDYYLFLSRPTPYKGLGDAIRLCQEVGFKLVISMPVELAEHAYFGAIYMQQIEEAREKGAQIEVARLSGGFSHHLEKRQLLREAKVLLTPFSSSEPFGLVLIEALACGTPVIGRRIGGLPEIITHGRNGFLYFDDEGFKNALNWLDQIDPRECREDAVSRFDRMVAAKRYLELYERLKEETQH